MTQNVELLDVGGNVFLVKASWRAFPSFAMQLDTLHHLASEVEALRALLKEGDIAEVSEGLESLSESLQSWVRYVRQYCDSYAIALPADVRGDSGESGVLG